MEKGLNQRRSTHGFQDVLIMDTVSFIKNYNMDCFISFQLLMKRFQLFLKPCKNSSTDSLPDKTFWPEMKQYLNFFVGIFSI